MHEPDTPVASPSPADRLPPPAVSGDKPTLEYQPQPPLSIGHLLLLTLGTALWLSVTSAWIKHCEPSGKQTFMHVLQVLYGIPMGAVIASLLLFAFRRLTRGPAFPTQPGHWLLLILGVVVLMGTIKLGALKALGGLQAFLQTRGDDRAAYAILYLHLCVEAGSRLFAVICYATACWQVPERGVWRWYFGLSAGFEAGLLAVVLVSSNWGLYQAMQTGRWLLPLLTLVAALTLDFRRRSRRDWLHWTGVMVTLSVSVVFLASFWWRTYISR